MIAYLRGKLVTIQDDAIIVEVGGIGYEILCPNPFSFQSFLNEKIKVFTYHYVREDLQVLYGFKDEDEKFLFTKLISVSGIGPKGALGIMSNINIPQFVSAVEQEDEKYLTGFPGVGKKTARQIILDLKGKLTAFITITKEDEINNVNLQGTSPAMLDAQEVLKTLGYTEREIKQVFPTLQKENLQDTDEIVRKALAMFAKK